MRMLLLIPLIAISHYCHAQQEYAKEQDSLLDIRVVPRDCDKGRKHPHITDCGVIIGDQYLRMQWIAPGLFRKPKQLKELNDTGVITTVLETRKKVYYISHRIYALNNMVATLCISEKKHNNDYATCTYHTGWVGIFSFLHHVGRDSYGRDVYSQYHLGANVWK